MTKETWFKIWLVSRPIIIMIMILGAIMSFFEGSIFTMFLQIIVALGEGYFLKSDLKKIAIKE